MRLSDFEESIKNNRLPDGLSVYLQALWYEANGNWNKAHSLIDSLAGKEAASVHAYLHWVEGDTWNANYWYNRAGRKMPGSNLAEEWKQLAKEFLEK